MAQMQGHDQVERHLPHRLDQQPAAESIALVKRQHRIDKGRAGGRETRMAENLLGRVDSAGDGLGNSGGTGLRWVLRLVPFQLTANTDGFKQN
jgi:hypothetical protein